jgi:hypothetical protein
MLHCVDRALLDGYRTMEHPHFPAQRNELVPHRDHVFRRALGFGQVLFNHSRHTVKVEVGKSWKSKH